MAFVDSLILYLMRVLFAIISKKREIYINFYQKVTETAVLWFDLAEQSGRDRQIW